MTRIQVDRLETHERHELWVEFEKGIGMSLPVIAVTNVSGCLKDEGGRGAAGFAAAGE
jgi:hypothetical protein